MPTLIISRVVMDMRPEKLKMTYKVGPNSVLEMIDEVTNLVRCQREPKSSITQTKDVETRG